MALVSILLGLILPSMASARARASQEVCVSNLRQWQLAWSLYAEDARGALVPNRAGTVDGEWRGTPDSWAGTHHARVDGDPGPLGRGALGAYVGAGLARVARCPDDRSIVQRGAGAATRVRSYSLNGNCHGRTGEWQQVVNRMEQIPDPANLFTFIDEHAESIDDGHFLVWAAPETRWVNLPAGRHRQHGLWAAADGHGAKARWQTPRTWSRRGTYWREAESAAERADLASLQRWVLPMPNDDSRP